jgi:predicted PurR-regulated permease PerM
MPNQSVTRPSLSVKISLILVGLVAFFFILYMGRGIIIPLVFALLIAILLNPLVNLLCNAKINRIIAIALSLLLTIALFVSLLSFIIWQATSFSDTFANLEGKVNDLYNQAIEWIAQTFKINAQDIRAWASDTQQKIINNGNAFIGQTINTIGGILAFVFLLPVYVFMILFYKNLLLEFIARLFPQAQHHHVVEILGETKIVIQSYLLGLLLEMVIIAVLNSMGFLLVGLQYAVLLGIIGALLNLIPYIGGLIAITLPMILAMVTKTPTDVVIVGGIYLFVQFIDNNFIVPAIVASRVRLNALVSIVVVLLGGVIWGVSGMFLAIPLTALVKVIFDRVPPLQPWGYLLGDDMPPITKQIFRPRKKRVPKTG